MANQSRAIALGLSSFLIVTGCSFINVRSPNTSASDCGITEPVVDSVAAAAGVGLGIFFVADYPCGDCPFSAPGEHRWRLEFIAPAFTIGAVFLASAIYGYRANARCRRLEVARETENQARGQSEAAARWERDRALAEEARQRARDQALALTKKATVAAEAGDCDQVKALDKQVREIDPEFHDIVFARDFPSIARCLAGTAPLP